MRILKERLSGYDAPQRAMAAGVYPYFREIESDQDTVVKIRGKDVLMFGSNSYPGLTNHPKIKEAAKRAIDKYGTGCHSLKFSSSHIMICNPLRVSLNAVLPTALSLSLSTAYFRWKVT